jgi:hypothetical protein
VWDWCSRVCPSTLCACAVATVAGWDLREGTPVVPAPCWARRAGRAHACVAIRREASASRQGCGGVHTATGAQRRYGRRYLQGPRVLMCLLLTLRRVYATTGCLHVGSCRDVKNGRAGGAHLCCKDSSTACFSACSSDICTARER